MIGVMKDRRYRILNLVAESYIESAHPVPSSFIAERLAVSSATVRNEFSALEQEGYLHQPHTSAGRIPTLRGFNTYALSFIPPRRLSGRKRKLVQERLAGNLGDALLQQIARVTTELSGYAVLVNLPADESLRALEIHLTVLSSQRLLAVVVLENGLVRQLGVELDPIPNDAIISDAERNLRQLTMPVSRIPKALLALARHAEEELARTLLAVAAAWSNVTPPRHFTEGLGNLLAEPESRDPDFMRSILEFAEGDETSTVAPEKEESLALIIEHAVARIITRLELGSLHGFLVLLGPSRMRYPDAFMVARGVSEAVTGQRLAVN